MLRPELVDLEELLEYPLNPKLHDIPGIAGSIQKYGFLERVVVNEATGHLLSGHGRRESLRGLRAAGGPPPENIVVEGGRWLVPADFVDLDPALEDEAVVVLNQLTAKGGWDRRKLTLFDISG